MFQKFVWYFILFSIDTNLKKSVKRELIKLSDNAHLLMVLKVMAD